MVPIAIIVVLIVIVFTVALVVAPDPATLSIFGAQINANTTGVYFTGAITMLVLLLALMMLRTGISRSVRHRKEVRSLKQRAEVGTGSGAAPDQKPADQKSDKEPEAKNAKRTGRKGSRRPNRDDATPSTPAVDRTSSDRTSSDRAPSDHSSADPTAAEGTTTSSDRQSLLDEADSLLDDERER